MEPLLSICPSLVLSYGGGGARRKVNILRGISAIFSITIGDGILITDSARGKIIDANTKACSMLGYSREELLSMPVSAIYPNDVPKLITFMQSVLESGQGWTDELMCLTKAEQSMPREISASVTDAGGTSCIVASVRDITERRQMEAALRENLAQLSRRNRYQTIISTVTQSVHQSILKTFWKMPLSP